MSHSYNEFLNLRWDLRRQLKQIGIVNLEQLERNGAINAWRRLVQAGLDDRWQTLLELEAAVEGTSWYKVPLERREELKLSAIAFSQGD
jgi:hypothetical protein